MNSLSQVEGRLCSLGATLEPLIASANRYVRFGAKFERSTVTIAPMSWIAPLANAFWIYEPLERTAIPQRVDCPAWYADVLVQMNGCFAFGLSLYGVPSPSGMVDRTKLRPLSLEIANLSWCREYKLDVNAFHFGSATLSDTENVGYFSVNDQIASIRENGEVVRSWTDFGGFLTDELARVEALAWEEPEAREQWSSV